MMDLSKISEDLFNKIRGRFPNVTIGDEAGNITNEPGDARFFDFEYTESERPLGKVSVSLSDDNRLAVIYSKDFVEDEDETTKDNWYEFLKELRRFSKKRMLDFDVRDITKTNLTKRDYKFLSQNNFGEYSMNESKLYGTGRISYQDVDNARIVIKHNESINQEMPGARTRNISNIYIESAEGERFKYPFRHLNGARAMARHVSEGGKPYDDFGGHITGLSEEMSKLRKFKNYMGRSSVMAESLADYMDIVRERIVTVKKTIENLQKPNYYREAVDGFETPMFEDVPEDVAENWVDQLTIKQFNEELSDVFPYIYNLVKEGTKTKALGPDDLLGEAANDCDESCPKSCPDCGGTGDPEKYKKDKEVEEAWHSNMDKASKKAQADAAEKRKKLGPVTSKTLADINDKLGNTNKNKKDKEVDEAHGNSKVYDKCRDGYKKVPGKTRGEKGSCVKEEEELEELFNQSMGQFGEGDADDYDEMPDKDVPEKPQIPLGEFILSYFDRHTGQFPKGETSVLTMVEKEYGDQFIDPAKGFIEQVNNLVSERYGFREPDIQEADDDQMSLDLPPGNAKKRTDFDKSSEYQTSMIKKRFDKDRDAAEKFEPGQRVRINVRGTSPFMKKDRLGDWHPTKIYPQGGFITGEVIKPSTLGDVLVKLDTPVKYRETVRGKRVTKTLDQTEFRHWRLTPLDSEKESQELNDISRLAGL